MKKFVGIVLVALGFFSTAGVKADPIGGSSCASCYGTTITLEYSVVTATNYIIHLFINTTGYNANGNTPVLTDWISAVAVNVNSNTTAASLASTTAPGTWSAPVIGTLSNGNCADTGANFVCTSSSDHLALTNGATYEWVFNVTGDANNWLLADGTASIKANYDPHSGLVTSENITLQQCPTPVCTPQQIPEPGILSLLAVALIGMGVPMLRRRKAKA